MATYKKKRARELQHDPFRDTTLGLLDRLGHTLEGKGRKILYGLGGVILVGLLALVLVRWSGRKTDEARQALGRAIDIEVAAITTTPGLAQSETTFTTDRERAQRAIDEFEKVAAKYGDPYRSQAQYFIASNRLILDRQKGISELTSLGNSSVPEVGILAKFALAQAYEGDNKLDDAAKLYLELAKLSDETVTSETANLRLAKVYAKQGKKKEASDLLFNIADASRKAKGSDNQPLPISAAAREAATELQKVDPDRYAQLPPESPMLG